MSADVRERLQGLHEDVAAELRACGRARDSVTIVGVSKKQPAEAIAAAAAAGLTDIAENYVQEARAKFAALDELSPQPVRHFIGHLQTNKASTVARLFDVVQSVDRPEAARALARGAAAAGKRLRVLVQVNVSPSERFGCPPGEAGALADIVRGEASLQLDGVMAIGPIAGPEGDAGVEAAFALAAMTFGRVGGSTLSMGMSGDWRFAVRAGSTMIRIGTALFGERPSALRGG